MIGVQVKFDGCGPANNLTRWAELINHTGHAMTIENCHWGGTVPTGVPASMPRLEYAVCDPGAAAQAGFAYDDATNAVTREGLCADGGGSSSIGGSVHGGGGGGGGGSEAASRNFNDDIHGSRTNGHTTWETPGQQAHASATLRMVPCDGSQHQAWDYSPGASQRHITASRGLGISQLRQQS